MTEIEHLRKRLDRAFKVIETWEGLFLAAVKKREVAREAFQIEIQRLKELVTFFQRQCNESYAQGRASVQTASEIQYAAQNELETLRLLRVSHEQAIKTLQAECAEACAERDAASKRANGWRDVASRVVTERDAAREGLAQARVEINTLYKEMDVLRKDLDVSKAINRIAARRSVCVYDKESNSHRFETVEHGYANPRLEMMLEESYRNEFKRNIDNQKAVDGANCPSS